MDIIVPRTLNIQENVKGFQVDRKSGLYVKDTYFEGKNTLQTALKSYLAYKIGTDTTDRALDTLFTFEGGSTEAGAASMSGYDGITYETHLADTSYFFYTTLDQGGDNTSSYIEFKGYLNADATTGDISSSDTYLMLGHNHGGGTGYFTTYFSKYTYTLSILEGRIFYFYWRISAV